MWYACISEFVDWDLSLLCSKPELPPLWAQASLIPKCSLLTFQHGQATCPSKQTSFLPPCLCSWLWEAFEQSCLGIVLFDWAMPPLSVWEQASNTQIHWWPALKWPRMRTLLSRTALHWMGLASGVPVLVKLNATNRRPVDTSVGSNEGI